MDRPSTAELDNCFLQFEDIKGVIVVSTPFYSSENSVIASFPVLYISEHEAASFSRDPSKRASIEFENLFFSLGLHETCHGLLLKKYPSDSSEKILASLADGQYRNLLLEANCSNEQGFTMPFQVASLSTIGIIT